MSSVAIITARGGSKRIPHKNIKDFLGKPIIAYSIKAALESGCFDEVMVSTDDVKIAEIAKEYGVRIYTIGFRTDNEVVQTPYGIMNNSEFDEKTLKSIASVTGGEYYRSSSKESLMNIYKEIDQLERTKLEVKHFGTQEEKFMIFAFIAIVSLMLEILLRNTVLKKIP